MTKLYFINKFILQWFFVRLTRHTVRIIDKFEPNEISIVNTNGYAIGGRIKDQHQEQWYSLQYWIMPCTGWNTDFKYLNKKPAYLKLTQPKKIN